MVAPMFVCNVRAVESTYEEKSLSIRQLNDESERVCKVVTDGTSVYIKVEDLIEIAGYEDQETVVEGESVKQITLKKRKDDGYFNQDVKIYPEAKMIFSNVYGEGKFDDCLNLDTGVYLNLVDIFNYLKIKAQVVENELLINIPVYTILDFMIYDYQEVLCNSVTQLDLLKPGEGKVSSGLYDALSLACKNFDIKLLVPIWGASVLKEEQYVKAIQTLNEDDENFYDENAREYMKNALSMKGFEGILATGKDLQNVMSIGNKSIQTVNDIIDEMGNASVDGYKNLVNWDAKKLDDIAEFTEWGKYAQGIEGVVNVADIVVSAYETYTRAKNWDEDTVDELKFLSNLEVSDYGDNQSYIKRIKKAAAKCLEERENKGEAVVDAAVYKMTDLLLEKVITETSIYGKIAGYFVLVVNTGVTVARCFGTVAEDMDKAELSYMVTCLINISEAARIRTEKEYAKLDRLNLNSDEIDDFREALRITLKSNLRCWSYIYYLNLDGEWENSYKGMEIKNKINKMNAYLALINESEQYDYALDEKDTITYGAKKIIEILQNAEHSLDYEMIEKYIPYETPEGVLLYENTIRYPYFVGKSYVDLELNEKYKEMIADFERKNLNTGKKYEDFVDLKFQEGLPYYDEVTSKVMYNEKGYISLLEVYSMWSGGMHPYNSMQCITYRLDTGDLCDYTEFLIGTDDEREELATYYLREKVGEIAQYRLDDFYNNPFVLTREGICFYVWMGDAVPQAEILIPYTDDNKLVISVKEALSEINSSINEEKTVVRYDKLSKSEICKVIADYYNEKYDTDIYVAFEDECSEIDEGYSVILRHQGGPDANILVGLITVNIRTGEVIDEWGNKWILN